ncbi:MAG: hypothetical protein L6Q98_20860 [Anaerolineae bacterium]|nr:hypothetical protein [Anaerolineae bacterium]NUQ06261.1 hypothetical protein [Anaerolineae bacterium]
MPSKDRLHDSVVKTLRAAGCAVLKEQVEVILPSRRLWIDLMVQRGSDEAIVLIEIKGFDAKSQVEYLSHTVGQYMLYRSSLRYLEITLPLYLAVPIQAYNGILSEALGMHVIAEYQISLVVFDPQQEEIIAWYP